jgi:hypothetical protein
MLDGLDGAPLAPAAPGDATPPAETPGTAAPTLELSLQPLNPAANKPGVKGKGRKPRKDKGTKKPRARATPKPKEATKIIGDALAELQGQATSDAQQDDTAKVFDPAAGDPPPGGARAAEGAAAVDDSQLATIIGLAVFVLAKFVPKNLGGGDLTPAERELIGNAGVPALKPHFTGTGGPWMMFGLAIGQTFMVRAMMYEPEPEELVTHHRPTASSAAPAATAPGGAPGYDPKE